MKFKTKQKRLVVMCDAYCRVHGVHRFTTDEVSRWAIRYGLYPVPKRGDDEDSCLAWERRLEAVEASYQESRPEECRGKVSCFECPNQQTCVHKEIPDDED